MMVKHGCLCLIALAMLCASAPQACAQPAQQQLDLTCPKLDGGSTPLAMGRQLVGNDCGVCHNQGGGDTSWILRNEFEVWEQQDRHSKAFLTLLGSRSKEMGDLLGVKDVSRDARCLACHASLPAELLEQDPEVVSKLLATTEQQARYSTRALAADGVTCEACHGAAGSSTSAEGWLNDHWRQRDWKNVNPEEKESKYGYYNVRSPGSLTRMCASCHVGDPERGRLVTHEMYAAGHPPLPPFEVETFLRDMPPHWRRISTSGENPRDYVAPKSSEASTQFLEQTQEAYYAQLRGRDPQRFDELKRDTSISFERARSIAIGAVVTWSQNARVTAAIASEKSFPLSSPTERWPELAAFECAACHHDLKLSGWRALRSPPSTPGRPMLRSWSSPLTEAVLASLDEDTPTAMSNAESLLQSATREQPYGDQQTIARVLKEAATAADDLAKSIENRIFNERDAKLLLVRITQVGDRELLDYESARQLVWAADSVMKELDPNGAWKNSQAALAAAKHQLTTKLAVHLDSTEDLQAAGGAVQQVKLVDLPEVLKPAAEYDAGQMQQSFSNLLAALRNELPR